MVPRAGHQDAHDRGALTASGSGRVRFGSARSRDGAWGILKFWGGVRPTTPWALTTPKEGQPSWILKVHYVLMPGVSLAGGYRGMASVMPGFSGQHEVRGLPGVIIVLPLDKGSGTLKAGKVHGVNSIHPFNNHLDRCHTHGKLQGDTSAFCVPDSFQTTSCNTLQGFGSRLLSSTGSSWRGH